MISLPSASSAGVAGTSAEVEFLVDGLLAPFAVDALLEVTLRVEEADADEGQPQVAGRLAVIAGQDAQAAGVDGQRFVQPKLGEK